MIITTKIKLLSMTPLPNGEFKIVLTNKQADDLKELLSLLQTKD